MKFKFSLATLVALAAAAPTTPDGTDTSGLKVDLTLVSNTQVKAVLTNTGKDDLKLLKTGTILSSAPVHKVRVTQKSRSYALVGIISGSLTNALPQMRRSSSAARMCAS